MAGESRPGASKRLDWTLIALACLLAAITVALAVYWLDPVEVTSLPRGAGPQALSFPLHLLLITVASLGLGLLALWLQVRLAAGIFGLAAILSALLALWPSVAMWRLAQQEDVSLSLATYLAYAMHRDGGGPQLERTVEYGVAPDGTKLVLDVWLAKWAAPGSSSMAIVKVHGGGWSGGSSSEGVAWNKWLNELGYSVFDVEYRLSPPERWKDEVGDVKCALGGCQCSAIPDRSRTH
jgi:hypothetical protein